MSKNPVLELPIDHVMRQEIALPLQHMMNIYTVGNFLSACATRISKSTSSAFSICASKRVTPSRFVPPGSACGCRCGESGAGMVVA